jgi:hypothetical protein
MLSIVPRPVKRLAIASLITIALLLLMAAPALAHSFMAAGAQGSVISFAGCGQAGSGPGPQQWPSDSGSGAVNPVPATSPDAASPPRSESKNRSGRTEPVVQLSGEVMDVSQISSKQGWRSGVHILLQTNGDTVEVRLGPRGYLEELQFSLEPDDWVTVESTRSHHAGTASLIAYQIIRGEQVWPLRDENGIPLWRARPRPPRSESVAFASRLINRNA